MENKPYGSVIGNARAPYENVLAKQCGIAADYHGIRHPSLPNYLAATGGSTFGVRDDAGPSAHPISADSIFGQLDRAGLTWRSYEESMPRNCDASAASPYAVKHNPAAYFTAIRASCAVNDIPLTGNLDRDIVAGKLPSFSFVTPNLCNDTHDCSVRTGDSWLATWIPKILAGPNYRAGDTLVVLTWDEGVGSGNQIPTIVIAPSVRPGTVAEPRLDHYALLRTTEDLLGLARLGAAASAPSLAAAFGL
jgi:phosphatidylinositol-3-phosphatase